MLRTLQSAGIGARHWNYEQVFIACGILLAFLIDTAFTSTVFIERAIY